MYYYSVTVSIEQDCAQEWLTWMTAVHIPEVMATGLFNSYRMLRVTEPVVELDAVTYNIQYAFDDLQALEAYRQHHAPALQAAHSERYRDRFVAFRTVLQEV